MCEILVNIVIVSLLAAMVVLLVKKWGIAEWVQVNGNEFLSKLFSCDLCMSFWAALCICAVVACYNNELRYMFVPLFSTPISRMLV